MGRQLFKKVQKVLSIDYILTPDFGLCQAHNNFKDVFNVHVVKINQKC